MRTTTEDVEKLHNVNGLTDDLSKIDFENSIPLTVKPAISLPPLEAVLLYGGEAVQQWLSTQGLKRWEYSDVTSEVSDLYQKYVGARLPLFMDHPPVARIGGWHILWSDDDYYLPREMRLMVWTFQDAEPWYEVFLSPQRNYIIKERIT